MRNVTKADIFVVDDEPGILEAVRKTLERAGYNCTCFSSAKACLEQLRRYPCNLLVTDVKMPDMGGLKLLEKTKAIRPALPVLVITAYGDIQIAVKAMKAGAASFIEKPLDTRTLLDAVQAELERPSPSDSTAGQLLSKTEIRVLTLILEGKTNRQIGQLLHRSVRTIEDHRSSIMHKLGAENLIDLVKQGARMGLFRLPTR